MNARKWLLMMAAVLLLSCCAVNQFKSDFTFGNKLAQEGLWKEAMYRWQKVLHEGQDSAAIHNNLAVGYEHDGKYQEAEVEYQLALKLAPKNEWINENYKRFKRVLKHDFKPRPEHERSNAYRPVQQGE